MAKENERPDIVEAISALARERDISEEMLLSTVEEACKAAFRKSGRQGAGAPMNLSVVIARKKPVQVFARKVVVEEVEDSNIQISLPEALAIRPDFQLGDIVEIDVTPNDFGRVAAQTAKQVIVQRIREAERDPHRHRAAGGAQVRVRRAGPDRGRYGGIGIHARGRVPRGRPYQGVRPVGAAQPQ